VEISHTNGPTVCTVINLRLQSASISGICSSQNACWFTVKSLNHSAEYSHNGNRTPPCQNNKWHTVPSYPVPNLTLQLLFNLCTSEWHTAWGVLSLACDPPMCNAETRILFRNFATRLQDIIGFMHSKNTVTVQSLNGVHNPVLTCPTVSRPTLSPSQQPTPGISTF